ncbi:hypothetical protein AeMF1_002108 [Aphanomyces euteiches]|nr:hypothetical protein AeMF1_002108 [Aphanomyces euteiches]KAH9183531.1 hypothetical protein AeNC1_014492 [Aphanomyces euteiches]
MNYDLDLDSFLPQTIDLPWESMQEAAVDSAATEDTTSDEPPPPHTKKCKIATGTLPKSGRRPVEALRRQELADLKQQVRHFESQLEAMRVYELLDKNVPRWMKIARHQRNQVRKALEERKHLQQSIDANLSFIALMSSQIRRNEAVHDWRLYKLVADKTRRHAAIHAIANREFDRKDTVFIQAGLLDYHANLFRVRPLPGVDRRVAMLEIATQVTLPIPCEVVGQALWQVFNGEKSPPLAPHAYMTLEHLDDHTVYERFHETRHGVVCHANIVRKYFADSDEHVIVMRSIAADDAEPGMADDIVEDRSSWMAIVPLDDMSCRFTFLIHSVFDPSKFPTIADEAPRDLSVRAIEASYTRVHVEDMPTHKSIFPTDLSYLQDMIIPPGYDTFLDRGMQFKAAHREAILAAAEAFNRIETSQQLVV